MIARTACAMVLVCVASGLAPAAADTAPAAAPCTLSVAQCRTIFVGQSLDAINAALACTGTPQATGDGGMTVIWAITDQPDWTCGVRVDDSGRIVNVVRLFF